MLKLRGELNFSAEAIDAHARRHLGTQNFYDDLPLERAIDCDEDATHSRATELAVERIGVAERRFERAPEIRQRLLILISHGGKVADWPIRYNSRVSSVMGRVHAVAVNTSNS